MMHDLINADWYVPRDCELPLNACCDMHGCDDCQHDGTGYRGCPYCSEGVLCMWVQKP